MFRNLNLFTFAMNRMAMSYPQYRKYKNNKVYFKILSDTEWEELHVSKKSCTVHLFTARILPDRNYLMDMTFDYQEHWEAIQAEEYEMLKNKCNR